MEYESRKVAALLAENQRLRDEYKYWQRRAHTAERSLDEADAGIRRLRDALLWITGVDYIDGISIGAAAAMRKIARAALAGDAE